MYRILICILLISSLTSCESNKAQDNNFIERVFESKNDKIAYYLGYNYFEFIKKSNFYNDLNHEMLIAGFSSAISNDSSTLSHTESEISNLIGKNGKDFNPSYRDSGSYYLGKHNRYILEMYNEEYGVKSLFQNKIIVEGFADGLNGNFQLSQPSISECKKSYYAIASSSYNSKQKQNGIDFLNNNKKNPKIKVTNSGLQYEVLKMGKGPKPGPTTQVKVHYHGTTPQGDIFDSSVDRGEPSSFGLNQVIKGWTEGLQLMPVGSKFKFYIPQELAYGANPRPGGPIKPYMPLVFEVELLEILK